MPRASGGLARRRSTLRSVNFFVDDFKLCARGCRMSTEQGESRRQDRQRSIGVAVLGVVTS
jgi:hypothetical protein